MDKEFERSTVECGFGAWRKTAWLSQKTSIPPEIRSTSGFEGVENHVRLFQNDLGGDVDRMNSYQKSFLSLVKSDLTEEVMNSSLRLLHHRKTAVHAAFRRCKFFHKSIFLLKS